MTSKIEESIADIREYIDNCKNVPLSSGKIMVNKEEIDELLEELQQNAPEEIKQLRKIVANSEAILNDAKAKAEALINDATIQTNQLLSENEIMLQAYQQADEVVAVATQQAQSIVDNATEEANQLREAAYAYMDEMLANMENIFEAAMQVNENKFQEMQGSMEHFYNIVKTNRAELHAGDASEQEVQSAPSYNTGNLVTTDTDEINLDMI